MSKKSRLWLVAVVFAAFAAAFVWALVLFATKPALAAEDIHPELVLKADKQVLYVSGKDSDKTVTVTPELLNSDGEIDPSALRYYLDQGKYFGDGLSLTDFYQNDVIDDYEGKITFSINPELTVETFLETYGTSQELHLSANYDYYLYPLPLSAQINLTVKAAKDRISLKWAGKEFFADEDAPDFQADTLVLKKGEVIRLEYSVPESSAESAFWGDNGIIRLSNQTETVKNGLKTVTAEAEAIKTGSDMLCVKWNTFTLKLPVRVEESDAVDFPVFSEDFELFKFNGETLITSEKGLSLDRIFKNMYAPNGILTYNGKSGEGRRIEITVEKDGKAQEFKGDVLGSGRYTFRFTLPVKSGVTWADGSFETVEKSAVLGAPIYNVVINAKSLVYNGSQRLWSEFAAVTKDGRQVSPEDLPVAVVSENMRDAGAYEISFALEEEEAFLTLDGNPTDGEAVLETIISKAELTLKFSGNARYTGAKQIIDCAAVKTEYSKEFPQDEYSTAEISFIAGAEVVNAGEYPFTAAVDSFDEKAVRVDFNHKNYTLVKAEGVFTVTPAETGAETYTGNEYDGGNHFDDAARINFTGLVEGETFSCGVDYSVTVKSGGVPTENVKDVGLYAVEITLLTDNYVFESGLKNLNSDFLVTPKEITAVVSAPSKTYNGLNLAAVPDIGVIFEGLAVGDSLSVADINIEGTAVNAGIYNFSAETGGENVLRVSLDVGVKNYTLFKTCGTFEILPAKLRISLNGKSVYNGKELDLNAAEISLAIKNEDYDYSEIFGVYSLNFKAERAVKDFKTGGYSFGISDNADIAVSLKDEYANNFIIESADGVFVVEKSVITVCGDYFGQMEYGAPLSVKAPLTEYAGLSAEGIYDGDVGITLSYELPDGSVGNYGMEKLSLEGELTGKNAFNYTLSIKINSFNVQIVRAKIVGKGQGDSPAVTFFFVDSDGSEKPLYETSEFIFDGMPREVRAYGATAYNDKIAMNLSGGTTFCGAGNYEFFAANPDVNLYEYSDGENFIKITVKKRGVSAEISASCEYNGSLILPAEKHGLNVKFSGDVQYDRLTVSDLIFCGGAISAGSHKIGLGDEEITVKLGERALNYYLESVAGSFEILPATIKITGSANKPVRYTGGRVEAAFFALSEGLSMQSFAQADGVEVQFKLLTSSASAGSYFYPNDSDGGLTVSYSVSVPEEKSENYSKDGGDFAVDFSEARFSVKIVMAEIVTVKWFLGRDGNFIPFDGGALKFDAYSYCVFAEAEYIDENGDLRSLGKGEISISVRGLTPEDEKRLVYSGDTAAIRNAGEYYASLESDVYAIKDGIKSVAIKIEPYVFEIKGHAPAEKGDLLYGGSTIEGIDGGEVVLGTKAYSEAVRATYSLDVTQTKDGKRANFDFAGFASADTYYNLIPFDIILSSESYYFDSSNYVCICPNNYALKIAPVTVRAERAKYDEVYAGFMGEEGIFTAEKLARKAAIVFSESQAGGMSISENLELPDFGVKFSGGNLSDFKGVQAAVNAGEYSFCLILENANFCFEDGTDTITFIIKPAEISVVLEKSESIYCAEDFSGDIRLEFFCGAKDVSSCFCDGAGNAIGVSPDGIFGVEGGAPSFGMKFFADPYFSALTNVQLKDVGTYCVKTEFCEYISENFILDTASENLIYSIKPSEILLEADSLDFTENSDYTEIFSGLRDYLVYDKNSKEIIISTAAVTGGESDGKYFIPMYRVFGEIKGFYGEKDFSALTVTLATSAEAAIYKVAVSVGHSENYKVQCPILSAQIEVAPLAVEVEWRFNGSAAKSGASITFNGNDRLSEFSAAATGIDGETIALSEPSPVLVRDGNRITDVGLLNAGVYELSVSSENRNYMLSGNVLNVEIAPRPVTGGELLQALVWRNSSNGNSLLQDGCYNVDSEKVDAANSFVGYKNGMDNAIVMGEAPQTCGCPAFTVKYTGNNGENIGGYCLKATLSLGGNLHGELFFVNFAWESGFYENLRGDGGKDYGETISYNRSSGCIEVTKKWYVVILNNGLESGLELPAAEGGVNVNYGWTFGNDFRICGYPSPLRDNAVTYVSFGRFSDGTGAYGENETFSEAVWRNNFEIARICVAYSPENRDLADGKIRNFIDFWLNAATPAGDYAVIVYIAEEESGGEIYAPYFEIWRFSVLTSPLSFTENPFENFEAEYDGTPHFFKDGRMPKFDNLSGEEIDGLRRGTGWAAESVERPAGNSFNIDILYGRSGETYAQLRILITDDISDGYHDISDSSDDWNLLANPALPISVGASGSGGGAYVLFYKIILANYDEYATVGGCRLSAEECRYSVKINARIISLEAWGGGGITVSGDKLSWESGAADEVDFTVTGWIACGGELDFRYKFLPVREDGENTITENYPEFSAKTENGVLRLVVPGYADSGKFILYIYMYNYEFSASKSAGDWTYENENFVLEGDETWEEGGVEVFKIYVGADAVGEKGEKQKSKPLAAQTKTNVGFWSIIFTVLAALVIAAASALIAAFHVNRHR